jgi:hypothetical protein
MRKLGALLDMAASTYRTNDFQQRIVFDEALLMQRYRLGCIILQQYAKEALC